MLEIFETPFPLMFAFVLFIFLGRAGLKEKRWGKVIRFLALSLIVINLLAWHNAYVKKSLYIGLNSNARQVTRFTEHITSLIETGNDKKAVQLLSKFSKEFPQASVNYRTSETLIDELTSTSEGKQTQK